MKALPIRFPWNKIKKGQGFFVPCLDTQLIKETGLRQAVSLRILDARAAPGLYTGVIGVWFYRPAPARSSQTQSSVASNHPESVASHPAASPKP